MQKILFTILFNLFFTITLFSQNIHQIKAYSDGQFEKGNYTVALKEYQRVLFFDDDKLYNDVYSKIAAIYYHHKNFENAVRYLNFAWTVENNDSLKLEIIFKKTLCNLILKDYYAALNELLDISEPNSEYFRDKLNLYTGICYFGLADYAQSNEYLHKLVDSFGEIEIDRVFNDFIKFNKKYRPEKIELMSTILPGLGQFYMGEIGSGINSVILLSGIVTYAFYTTMAYGWIDGFLVLSSWFYRYYNGGALKANLAAIEKLDKKKIQVYSEIISIVENQKKSDP